MDSKRIEPGNETSDFEAMSLADSRVWDRMSYAVIAMFAGLIAYLGANYVYMGWPDSDSEGYLQAVADLRTFDPEFHGIGYPLVVAIFHTVIGDVFTAGKVVSAISGILFLGAAWKLTRVLFGPIIALLSTFFLAVTPGVILSSYIVYADALAAGAFMFGLLLMCSPKSGEKTLVWSLAGMLTGFSFITRYSYAAVPAVVAAYIFLLESGVRRQAVKLITYFVGFALVVTPWGLVTFVRHGSPFFNLNHANLAIAALHDGTPKYEMLMVYANQYNSILDFVVKHPGLYAKHIARNSVKLFSEVSVESLSLAGLLVIPGFVLTVRRWSRHVILFVIVSASIIFVYAHAWWDQRYIMPFMPLLSTFAAITMTSDAVPQRIGDMHLSGTMLGDHFGWFPIRRLLVSVCIVLALVMSFRKVTGDHLRIGGEGIHEAGMVLRTLRSDYDILLTTSSTLAYYADISWVRMLDIYGYPNELEPVEFCKGALDFRVDLMGVVYPHTVRRYPTLEHFLEDGGQLPPCLELIYRTENEPLVELYRLKHGS